MDADINDICSNFEKKTNINNTERPELSPMSLLFYLCQSNKLSVLYTVVEETGPSHDKLFKVRVTLGDVETYYGLGKSIKNAKRDAAQNALNNTKLCKEVQESKKKKNQFKNNNLPSNKISYVQTPRSELNRIAQERGIQLKVNTTEEEVIEDGGLADFDERIRINRISISQNNNNLLSCIRGNGNDDKPIAAPDFSKRNNLKITKIYRTTIEILGQTFSCKARTKQASLHAVSTEVLNFLHTLSPLSSMPCMYNPSKLLDDYVSRNKLKMNLECENTNGQAHIPFFRAEYSIYSSDDWKRFNKLFTADGYGKCKKTAKFEAASNMLNILEQNFNHVPKS